MTLLQTLKTFKNTVLCMKVVRLKVVLQYVLEFEILHFPLLR